MSVGKASIKRAANAGTKKAAEVKETTTEIKAPEAVKADNVKAPAKTAAKKTTSRSSAAKTTAAKKTTARKTTAKSAAGVKTSVLTPSNSEEIQAAFISDKAKQPENTNAPVHVTEDLPVYLL
ncbi:hypothetical protein [Blautia sp.]|uniref:hypothetical protein n=1 Tax=Blautia sp. TaxID=1955243 RepID=UPI002943A2A1|nr:hypothetical protein [Blautia sp.]MDY3016996.1 hypothetical protein [Blautia sp.]